MNLARFFILLALAGIAVNATASEPVIYSGATELGGPVAPAVINIDPERLPVPKAWQPGDPIKEMPLAREKGFVPPIPDPRPVELDPLVERDRLTPKLSGGSGFDTPIINVGGGDFSGVNPSDTVGDIGNEYYVQMINASGGTEVLILDKTDGSQAAFFTLESLAVGSGTGCVSGRGDPIVNFDESVDNGPGEPDGRWMLTEFTTTSFCVYISQTSDPTTGDWFLYEYTSDTGGLPDYPKFGVWPDGYYIGANEGPRQYVLDRENMLEGLTARPPQVFTAPGLPGFGFQHIMPVDWDGDIPPPAGAPGLFMRHRDDEIHNVGNSDPASDILELWEFSVDWDNAGNSTFTGPINISMAEFDSEFCNLVFSGCLPQPTGSTTLFALLQPIMWRAQYRNFGSHQATVANMVTDVDGNDTAGVRWFELRDTGSGWFNFQEGTISEGDGTDRWMASAAMDESGNIAVGYNVVNDGTGSNVFPGMRYAGRLVSDPPGTTPRGENTVISGTGSNGSVRYGDYTSVTVDPVDGCTFWFTAQHNPGSQWDTQIASFKFNACGEPGFALGSPDGIADVCIADADAPYAFDIEVFQISGFTNPVSLSVNPPAPAGISTNFSINPVNPPGTTELSGTVNQSASTGNHILNIEGSASGADNAVTDLLLNVFDQSPGLAQPDAPADGEPLAAFQPTLEWTPGNQSTLFTVEIDDDPDFSSLVYTAEVSGTSHVVATPLNSSTEYYWRVRATNACGDTESPAATFTTQPAPGDCPADVTINQAFFDDMESGINGWTHNGTQDSWTQSSDRAFSGALSWHAEDLPEISDQRLVSPPVALPSGQLPMTLIYQNHQTIEDASSDACWDGAILEITTDGGTTWTQLSDELLTDPYDGVVNNFTGGPNPLAGLEAWCADPQDWTRSVVDLAAFQGETVQFRFRLGTDGTVGREGWYIDDVTIQACELAEDIYADGFESN